MTHDKPFPPELPFLPPRCQKDECSKVGYQYADISIPIELKPDTAIGQVTMECCSEPTVTCKDCGCENACEVVVTQKVNIRIPVHYQITACMGESMINCKDADCDE